MSGNRARECVCGEAWVKEGLLFCPLRSFRSLVQIILFTSAYKGGGGGGSSCLHQRSLGQPEGLPGSPEVSGHCLSDCTGLALDDSVLLFLADGRSSGLTEGETQVGLQENDGSVGGVWFTHTARYSKISSA